MKRPAFQFYPDNWRNNANLRRCSWQARGAWIEVMCLMHDSDRYGVLEWPLKEIAQALGCPAALLRELIDKGVLKGCDRGDSAPFVYTPRSGRKDGPPVTLVPTQAGPVWYSSRMVVDEYKRLVRGDGDASKASPKGGIGACIGDSSKGAIGPCAGAPPPPSPSPPSGSSAPDGAGGKPPMTPDEIIFGYGVPLLVNAGTPEKQARSFLGALRKRPGGDEAVVDALRNCLREKPLQPLEWLAAALPPAAGPSASGKANRQEAIEQRNREQADRWAADMEAQLQPNDAGRFARLFSDVMAYYRQDVSQFTQTLFWGACEAFSFEQVQKAFNQHAKDPEHGQFPPKVADLVRILQGTHTDRAQLAWGKALEAMSSVGAYTDVVFDDPAIHACIEDMGGWPKVCRTETKELSYLQHRFCESHKAYTGRGTFPYPRRLAGDRSPDSEWEKKGLPVPKPALVGDRERCRLVYQGGQIGGKTQIGYQALDALVLDRLLPSEAA